MPRPTAADEFISIILGAIILAIALGLLVLLAGFLT